MGFLAPLAGALISGIGSAGAAIGSAVGIGGGAAAAAGIPAAVAVTPAVAGAAGAATSALSLGSLATGLEVGGGLVSGLGGLATGLRKAGIDRQNATQSNRAGQAEAEASLLKYGGLVAEQEASFAANGLQVGSGAVQDTLRTTRAMSALDAAMIHYDAASKAYGFKEAARNDTAEGFGKLASGIFAAGTSLVGGSQSTSNKWAKFRDVGVPGG